MVLSLRNYSFIAFILSVLVVIGAPASSDYLCQSLFSPYVIQLPRTQNHEIDNYLDEVEAFLKTPPEQITKDALGSFISLYLKAKKYEKSDYSHLVATTQLYLRRLYYRAENLAPMEDKDKFAGIRLTWFNQRTAEEDDIVGSIQEKIVRSLQKNTTKVKQIELERRINIPAIPISLPLEIYGKPVGNKIEISEPVEILRYLYIMRNLFATSNMRLTLSPLVSKTDHFHNGWNDWKDTSKKANFAEDYVETAKVNFYWDSNYYNGDLIFNHQLEDSTYFDTPDFKLLNKKIAVRIKSWLRPKDGVVTAKSVFIKKTLDINQNAFFTEREEIYQHLNPDQSSEADLDSVKRLLKEEIGAGADGLNVTPVRRVINDRRTLDIMWRDFKVGFLTIDLYSKDDSQFRGHTLQWEIEILPEWRPLYEAYQTEFESFFIGIEKLFNGRKTTTPKYAQTTKDVTTGLWVDVPSAKLKETDTPTALMFKVIPMKPGMKGDDDEIGLHYFSQEERERAKIYAFHGRLYDYQGRLLNTNGKPWTMVMDGSGNFYSLSKVNTHSVYLAGSPAGFAGNWIVDSGIIKELDNGSGHYRPPNEIIDQPLNRLTEMGISIYTIEIQKHLPK